MLQSNSLSSRLPNDLPSLAPASTNLWVTGSSVVVTLVAIAAVYKGALHPSLGMKITCFSTATGLVAQDHGVFSTLRAVDTHLAAVKKVYAEAVSSEEIPSPPNMWGATHKVLVAHQIITFVGLAYLLYLGHLPKRACVSVAAFASSAMTLTRTLTQAIRQRALHDLEFYSMGCKKKLNALEKEKVHESERVEEEVKDQPLPEMIQETEQARREAAFQSTTDQFQDGSSSDEEDRDSIFNDSFC